MPEEKRSAPHHPEREVPADETGMANLLSNDYAYQEPRPGNVVEGTVLRAARDGIVIDVGCKSEGFVVAQELEMLTPEEWQEVQVGNKVLAYVLRSQDAEGNVLLSLRQAQAERDWRRIEELHRQGEVFEARIIDCNRGGVIARLGKVRGFVPASQLVSLDQKSEEDPQARSEGLARLKGEKLFLKVIELDRSQERLILSERAALQKRRREQKERLLAELKPGDIRRGEISSITDFGAFVDLGGADGLIHISELSWRRVSHPSQVFKVGDEVEVYVLNVDQERQRIGLSLKQLQTDPWSQVEELYSPGQLVQGTITKLTDFGAFAELNGGLEGLIHISELADRRISHPREVVKEGEVHTLRILQIDAAHRRLGLSLKRVKEGLDYVDYRVYDKEET